jgi:hypothetical protein
MPEALQPAMDKGKLFAIFAIGRISFSVKAKNIIIVTVVTTLVP